LNSEPSVKIAKVNCDIELSLCAKFNLTMHPTLKYIQDGKIEDFIAERTVESIVETVKLFNKPVVDDSDVVKITKETFDQFLIDNDVTIIMFYGI
jgi:thioredoxin-like negative regulator of GroEL